MTPGMTDGWVLGLYGPERATWDASKGGWYVGSLRVSAARVFSTEGACVAGREPRARRKLRKTGTTHAERTEKK